MTSNQIAYWKAQEEKRSNKANEALKDKDINVKRQTEVEKLSETKRHNEKTEAVQQTEATAHIAKGVIDSVVNVAKVLK